MEKIFLILFTLVFTRFSYAYLENDSPDSFSGLTHMNGYKFSDYKGFDKKWKLVTVRFRKDTGELRFTYANKIAWDALMKGGSDYPDGAIFGKVGLATEADPRFESSAVPSGARRYQLMIKDKVRHKETRGWGYALFDGEGKTFPEDPKIMTQACMSCHDIVPESGYIFSFPMEMAQTISLFKNSTHMKKGFSFKKEKLMNQNPSLVMTLNKFKEAVFLNGNLRKFVFQGTLDEIIPTLMKESQKSQLPAILASEDYSRFTAVYPVKRVCPEGDGFEIIQTQTEKDQNKRYTVKKRISCK